MVAGREPSPHNTVSDVCAGKVQASHDVVIAVIFIPVRQRGSFTASFSAPDVRGGKASKNRSMMGGGSRILKRRRRALLERGPSQAVDVNGGEKGSVCATVIAETQLSHWSARPNKHLLSLGGKREAEEGRDDGNIFLIDYEARAAEAGVRRGVGGLRAASETYFLLSLFS